MKQIALATLRWILVLPCAFLASVLIPAISLFLCGVLPGVFYWPFSFLASITGGYVFVWAGKGMAPSGKKVVGIILVVIAVILMTAEIVAVFHGFQFISYPRWLGVVCCVACAWGALSACFSTQD